MQINPTLHILLTPFTRTTHKIQHMMQNYTRTPYASRTIYTFYKENHLFLYIHTIVIKGARRTLGDLMGPGTRREAQKKRGPEKKKSANNIII
jgi:hypothetical protein